jgi:hypothetical protein
MQKYRQLAFRFIDNFKRFEAGCPPEVIKAGPRVNGSLLPSPSRLVAE